MKIFRLLTIAAAFALIVSCEKPPSEADKNAQVEKEVQARLAAEHQADDQQRLAQQQADLDAREKALADKESASAATPRVAPAPIASSSSERESTSSYDAFYRKLEPFGSWRETDEYGYVFQPREAQSRSWRPYTDGRWAYTDAGWTWVSDESFGWATYHYGRWARLSGVGWVWVPGEEWAPAWVSWRKGEQNVGWAPLPPEARFDRNKGIHKWADNYYDIEAAEYVFIPNEEIGAENIQRSVIPADRNLAIVSETTNVTNITYSNTTVVNEGPNFDELRGRSRRPLERMRIQREYDVERNPAPRATVSGEVLQMVTPLFSARATSAPRTSGPSIQRATVERGTAGGDQSQIERARQKMRSEATPPPDAPAKKFEKPAAASTASAPAAPVTVSAPSASTATAAPDATVPSTPLTPPRPPANLRPAFTPRLAPTPTAAPVATPIATPTAAPAASTPLATPRPPANLRPASTPRFAPTPVATPIATPTAKPAATVVPSIPAATAAPTAAIQPTPAPAERSGGAAIRAEQQQRKHDEMRAKAADQLGGTPAGIEMTPPPPKKKIAPPTPPTGAETPAAAASPAPNALIRERARRVLQPGVKPGAPADPQASPEPPKEP